jgi:hypothetical protein
MAFCRNCKSPTEAIKILQSKEDTDWLSQEEVKVICPSCYENMVEMNITKLKKSALVNKLGESEMEFYEVTYVGPENSKANIGPISLDPYQPQYFLENELPLPEAALKKLPNMKITIVKAESKPNVVTAKIAGAKIKGLVGVVWEGPSPARTNEHGRFERGKPRFDLEASQIANLLERVGFKRV